MPKHTLITAALRRPRTRRAVVVSGVCASLAMGTGAAIAADTGAPHEIFAKDTTASQLSDATGRQAGAQAKAAEKADKAAAAKKQAEAREKAEARKAAAEKKQADRSDSRGWDLPVSTSYTLTADFGNSGGRWASTHSGQDFAVSTGTPVKAVHAGTVVNSTYDDAYGNNIVIEHPNGKYSQYAHLSKIGVSPGEHVKTGSQIAKSGNSGNSTGPHLHFEIRNTPAYGSGVDPVPFLKNHGVTP